MEHDHKGRPVDADSRRPVKDSLDRTGEILAGGPMQTVPVAIQPTSTHFAPVQSIQQPATHSAAYVQLATAGEIGGEPSQLAPGLHCHPVDQIQGIESGFHRHDVVEIDGLVESIEQATEGTMLYDRLVADKRVGTGENQVAPGDHTHDEHHGHTHTRGQGDELSVNGLKGVLAEGQPTALHAKRHGISGDDVLNVNGLHGTLKDPQPPKQHAGTHIGGGPDALDVSGCKGRLHDPQPVEVHAKSHGKSGSDPLNVSGLHGTLSDPQPPAHHGNMHTLNGGDTFPLDGLKGRLGTPQPPEPHAGTHGPNGRDKLDVTGVTGKLATPQRPEHHASLHMAGGEDALTVDGLKGSLDTPQVPKKHHSSHQAGGGDSLDLTGLCGLLGEAQVPRKHAKTHTPGESDALNLSGLPGHPAELTAHDKRSGGVHGVQQIEDRERQGQPKGYPTLDESSRVRELPAATSGDPRPFAIPQCDDRGSLDKFIWATEEKVQTIVEKGIDSRAYLKEDGSLLTVRKGKPFSLSPGSPGDRLMIDPTGKPRWIQPADEDPLLDRPWLDKLMAAYGDSDPIKLYSLLNARNVANGPSPARLGKTIRCVLFRPVWNFVVIGIRLYTCALSHGDYGLAIYQDIPGSSPLCALESIDLAEGLNEIRLELPVFLDAFVDHWFCVKAVTSESREILQSLQPPAIVPSDRGLGLPVLGEIDSSKGPWGPFGVVHRPIRAMQQKGGVVPIAFLLGNES